MLTSFWSIQDICLVFIGSLSQATTAVVLKFRKEKGGTRLTECKHATDRKM